MDASPLAPVDVPRSGTLPYLGNRTSFESAWSRIRTRVRAARDPQLVLLGDGAIASTPGARAALAEITRLDVELSMLRFRDHDVTAELAAAVRSSLGVTVEAADGPSAIALLTAPIVDPDVRVGRRSLGPLRAGEERLLEEVWSGGATPPLHAFGRTRPAARARPRWAAGLATRLQPLDRRAHLVAVGRATREGGIGRGAGIERSFGRITTCGCGAYVRGGVSREAFARRRALARPAVRACFASARAGDPSWSARATVHVVIRQSELVSVRVSSTDRRLEPCLASIFEGWSDIPYDRSAVAAVFAYRSVSRARPSAGAPSEALVEALRDIGVEEAPASSPP